MSILGDTWPKAPLKLPTTMDAKTQEVIAMLYNILCNTLLFFYRLIIYRELS